jgi:hypothetical protein
MVSQDRLLGQEVVAGPAENQSLKGKPGPPQQSFGCVMTRTQRSEACNTPSGDCSNLCDRKVVDMKDPPNN